MKWTRAVVPPVTPAHWPQGTSKAWDTAPRGEPATGLIFDWLEKGKLEGMVPPPTQSID